MKCPQCLFCPNPITAPSPNRFTPAPASHNNPHRSSFAPPASGRPLSLSRRRRTARGRPSPAQTSEWSRIPGAAAPSPAALLPRDSRNRNTSPALQHRRRRSQTRARARPLPLGIFLGCWHTWPCYFCSRGGTGRPGGSRGSLFGHLESLRSSRTPTLRPVVLRNEGEEGDARRLPAGHPTERDERDDPATGLSLDHHRPSGRVQGCVSLD